MKKSDYYELIRDRRSIRAYEPGKIVPGEVLGVVLASAQAQVAKGKLFRGQEDPVANQVLGINGNDFDRAAGAR